jgi:type I restriction enzyme S subunit
MKLAKLMASKKKTIDPRKFPDDEFELFSIPAYDKGEPERILGSEIGSSKQILQPNDVLISRIVPHIRRSWVVPESNGLMQIGSSEWIIFRGDDFYPEYLRYYLLSDQFNAQFMSTVAGVGGSLLRARPAAVAKLEITLPDISKQKRIAAILNKADEIRPSAQEIINSRSRLIHSVYHSLMEGSERWPVVELSEVTENLDSKRVPIKASERIEGPYPYYGANGQQGSVHDYIFDEPLILVAEDGGHFFDPERPIAYRIEGKSWVNNHAHVLRCKPDMNIAFLNYQLAYYEVRPYLTGSTRAKLTKGALMKMPIRKPPMFVQMRFAAIVDILNSMSDRSELIGLKYNSIEQEIFA